MAIYSLKAIRYTEQWQPQQKGSRDWSLLLFRNPGYQRFSRYFLRITPELEVTGLGATPPSAEVKR
jgi:hypothetical protein